MVMQAGQDRDGDNDTGPLNGPAQGRILVQRQVRANLIVISRIGRKDLPQVRLAPRLRMKADDFIQHKLSHPK